FTGAAIRLCRMDPFLWLAVHHLWVGGIFGQMQRPRYLDTLYIALPFLYSQLYLELRGGLSRTDRPVLQCHFLLFPKQLATRRKVGRARYKVFPVAAYIRVFFCRPGQGHWI